MKFIKQEINQLKPTIKTKRTTIKGLLVVEQRHDLIILLYKYKSPVTLV